MKNPLCVLIIEDNDDDLALTVRELERGGFGLDYQNVQDEPGLKSAMESGKSWDIILSDYVMPQFNALAALAQVQSYEKDIPFIVLSGTVGEEVAVETMKAGAHDYLMKGSLTRLVPAIQRELREAKFRRERRAMQEQLLQAQKMESVGRLAGGIAHDFNNLLTAIIGYTELVADGLEPDSPAARYADNILLAANRGAGLIEQLLAFARKQILTPQPVDLNLTLAEAETFLQRLLSENIALKVEPAPGLWEIYADAGQCQQIVLNLAVNARDAMQGGGVLTIATENVTLEENNPYHALPGDYVLLTVNDTGIGMTENVQKHIFEPFFTTKDNLKGTGLGLATCHGIVEQSKGYIRLESAPEKGSTFSVLFPRLTRKPELTFPRKEIALQQGHETILLVEDDEMLRDLASETLQKYGYQVRISKDGLEALRMIQGEKFKPHLLLTDLVMPRMGGLELSSRLLVSHPQLKIVYMSGYAERTEEDDHFTPASFLQKPFTAQMLLLKVSEVLNSPSRQGAAETEA